GIGMKTDAELAELHSLGVSIAYMGLESGDDQVLADICKGATADKMIRMGKRVKQAGIQLSVTVLVGLAGKERSLVHATETGRVLSEIDPDYVGALSLMLIPGTELHADHQAGRFQLPDPMEMLAELGQMIASTHLTDGLFHANHASNYLPVRARLPRDKEKTLDQIARALSGKIRLKPEFMRAL
ncbi:MAG: radical SAM protein, partial [Desulfotignum sp.]